MEGRTALALFVGAAIGLTAGYLRWHDPFDKYANRRWVTMNRAADVPDGSILLIGDSSAERLYLPELCGVPVFNAGLSGAKVADIAPMIAPLIERTRPRAVIVSVGANDSDRYQERVKAALPAGAYVIGVAGRDNSELATLPRYISPPAPGADGVHWDARGNILVRERLAELCRNGLSK